MAKLEQNGWLHTYTTNSGEVLTIKRTCKKFERQLGYMKMDYQHDGAILKFRDKTYELEVVDHEHPNCAPGLVRVLKVFSRIIRLGWAERVERFDPDIVAAINELIRFMGAESFSLLHYADYSRIPFSSNAWEHEHDGYTYRIERRSDTCAYLTKVIRSKGSYQFPQPIPDGKLHPYGITEERVYFSTVAKPVNIEDIIRQFS